MLEEGGGEPPSGQGVQGQAADLFVRGRARGFRHSHLPSRPNIYPQVILNVGSVRELYILEL